MRLLWCVIMVRGVVMSCAFAAPAVASTAPCQSLQRAMMQTSTPSSNLRTEWRACYATRKSVLHADDRAMAIAWLQEDLLAMYAHTAGASPIAPAVTHEAHALAAQLVATTRARAAEFGMHHHPMWQNFLIHTGVKKFGYCYHWTSALAAATQTLSWKYFARVWGVASEGHATENNALIITARGAPLATGLAYDAWRGAGFPYWRPVGSDHYQWVERFNESAVANGIGDYVWTTP